MHSHVHLPRVAVFAAEENEFLQPPFPTAFITLAAFRHALVFRAAYRVVSLQCRSALIEYVGRFLLGGLLPHSLKEG